MMLIVLKSLRKQFLIHDLYAVEQLQMQLFPDEPTETVEVPFGAEDDGAVSALCYGKKWHFITLSNGLRITRMSVPTNMILLTDGKRFQ